VVKSRIENTAHNCSKTDNEALQEVVDSFTADRACADILDVAGRAGIDRFTWCGYSFGGGVG
jgi:pimeloyl-ACP methyl ester carboxylesterase